jgi:hypothetical protein
MKLITRWAILWQSENKLDGKTEYLICDGGLPTIFETREDARVAVTAGYGYIKYRKDLQQEPHGWKVPKVVRVKIQYTILKAALEAAVRHWENGGKTFVPAQGKAVERDDAGGLKCPECHSWLAGISNYCPDCGMRLRP